MAEAGRHGAGASGQSGRNWMQRYVVLDGFRGLFLLSMALAHFNMVTGVWLGNLHPQRFGWVDGAQGFVFVSGVLCGMVHGRTLLREGPAAARAALLARARVLYLYQAGLVLLLMAAALALRARAPEDLLPYLDAPVAFTLGSLALLSSSIHMGILPMYILFLLATPLAFALLRRGLDAPFAAAVVFAWMAAQTGLFGWGVYRLEQALQAREVGARFGLYFNAMGWQALFFGGVFLGFRAAQRRLDLGFLAAPQMRILWFMALGAFVALGLYDVAVANGAIAPDYGGKMAVRWPRSVLGPIYVFAFAVDLFLIAWLLAAGRNDPLRWVRGLAAGLGWLMTRPFLVLLGRHALPVFAFHIGLYYVLATVIPLAGLSERGLTWALVAAMAALWPAALVNRRWRAWRDDAGREAVRAKA